MYRESVQATAAGFEIQSEFDTVFIRQLNQFLGSEQLPQTTPLNLATIACMTLLAEREQEIEYAADNVPDRFRAETFNQALDDLEFPACLDTQTGGASQTQALMSFSSCRGVFIKPFLIQRQKNLYVGTGCQVFFQNERVLERPLNSLQT